MPILLCRVHGSQHAISSFQFLACSMVDKMFSLCRQFAPPGLSARLGPPETTLKALQPSDCAKKAEKTPHSGQETFLTTQKKIRPRPSDPPGGGGLMYEG